MSDEEESKPAAPTDLRATRAENGDMLIAWKAGGPIYPVLIAEHDERALFIEAEKHFDPERIKRIK